MKIDKFIKGIKLIISEVFNLLFLNNTQATIIVINTIIGKVIKLQKAARSAILLVLPGASNIIGDIITIGSDKIVNDPKIDVDTINQILSLFFISITYSPMLNHTKINQFGQHLLWT